MKWRKNKNQCEFVRPLEQERTEKLTQLGTQLRLQRQEQGISLEKVAAKTRIQRRLLQAIEESQIDELPEPIYVQSFIKQYANMLGLNGAELSSTFPIGDSKFHIKPNWSRLPATQLRPLHLYLLYIFVIVCAVNALSHTLNRSELQASSSQIPEKLFVPSDSKRTQVLPSEKLKSVSAALISKSVQISVTLKAQSWIRVVADGKTQFEGVLPAGSQRIWIAQEQLTVRAGNAGGVLVTFNQEETERMGTLGEVQEITFAANPRF